MTYVEKSRMNAPSIAMPTQESLCNAVSRIFHIMFGLLLRAWRNGRTLHELSQFDTAQLRDIGLTPYDVAAARLAPFHMRAGIMLAHLAERHRQSNDSTNSNAVQSESLPSGSLHNLTRRDPLRSSLDRHTSPRRSE